MANVASSYLFDLIKSMTKSEKRYFKVLSSRHRIGSENNYIRIFDFIDQLEHYDEEALFKKFDGETFLNKFSITKKRLQDSILKALVAFHANSSDDAVLYRMLHVVEVLYNKSLYKQAKKQLYSAKRLAEKNEKHSLLIEINDQIRKLFESSAYSSTDLNEIISLSKEDEISAELVTYYSKLWRLKSNLFLVINQKGKVRCDKDKNAYETLKKEMIDLGNPSISSFDTVYLYNHTWAAFHYAVNNPNKSLEHLYLNLALFKKNKRKIKSTPNCYFSVLSNIIHFEFNNGDYKKAQVLLKELKHFPDKNGIKFTEDLVIKHFCSTNSIALMLFIRQGLFEKATALSLQIEEGLIKYEDKITPIRKAYLAFNLSAAYFGMNDYKESLRWLNFTLNECPVDQKEDILAFAKLMNLVLHYELDNIDFLSYALKQTKHFLNKRQRNYLFEEHFLKHFTKLISADNILTKELIFKSLYERLEELENKPMESIALEYFDFKSWAEAKGKNKSFASVKRENYLSSLK